MWSGQCVTPTCQTSWSDRLKFVYHLGDITRQCSLETGPTGGRGSTWHELEKRLFRHWLNMGKIHKEVHETCRKCKAWVQYRADIWTTRCPIRTGQTGMSQGLIEKENGLNFVEQYLARATLQALWIKICRFSPFFRINFRITFYSVNIIHSNMKRAQVLDK